MKKVVWVVLGILALPLSVARANWDTEDAFVMQLNREGFQLISNEIRNKELNDVVNAGVPNVSEKGPLGIEINVQGLSYTVLFDSLAITPDNGKIAVDLGVKHVAVHANEMNFKKKILVTISSTCKNTTISAGHGGPLHLKAILNPTVQDRSIKLSAERIDFGIAENNFKVDGPQECSGALGVGQIIKWVVGKVINGQREKIEQTIRSKVADFIPGIEKNMNDAVHRKFPINVAGLDHLDDQMVVLSTHPYSLKVDSNQMDFHLSVDVAPEDYDPSAEYWDFADAEPYRVGGMGLNPALITEVFGKLFPNGSHYTELTAEKFPHIGEVFSVKTLSAIFPDLKEQSLGSNMLRGSVRFEGAPTFSFDEKGNVLKTTLPKFQVKFMAHMNGDWRDYFVLNLSIQTGVKLAIQDGKLAVGLTPENIVGVKGEWAKDYTPKNPQFEQEFTEFLFSSLLEYLASQGPLVRVDVPVTTVGGKKVTIAEPALKAPFVWTTLMALP